MARFIRQTPVITAAPAISVDAGLAPGEYRFSLVVIDEAGNESRPEVRTIRIQSLRTHGDSTSFDDRTDL
ncbi:MAG: hypothetical protein AAF756_00490 [Pseudomonadota bacterium]